MAALKKSSKINIGTVLLLLSMFLIVSNSCALAHTDVTVEQAKDLIDSTNDLVVVDVREQYEYCDVVGHIPGALNYPLTSGVLEARYEELPKDKPVLVVCRSGGRSNAAANFLDSKDFSMVYDMMGGMTAWLWETEPCTQDDDDETDSTETNTYFFLPEQSTLIQTGGIAGINLNYTIEGHFRLTVDKNAGTGSFTLVDAIAIDDNPFERTLDPNQVFNMNSLDGKIIDETTISFTGIASDGSYIEMSVTFQNDLVHLMGQTTPPANSADFFIFNLDATAQRKYNGGTGEPNDPYQIATAEDLILLGESTEDYDKHFILTADIDLDPNLPSRKVFDKAVIAREGSGSFTGVLDGNVHVISHLTIRGVNSLGLFGVSGSGAKISNLGLIAVDINGEAGIGGLVGTNHGNITASYSTGMVNGNLEVGGLVGANSKLGSIDTSHSSSEVNGSEEVGGLAGNNGGSITASSSAGMVTGNEYVGGLVGWSYLGDITASSSTGTVSGDKLVGGLVGDNYGDIITSYSTATVSSTARVSPEGSWYIGGVGGLVGGNAGSITASSSTGTVSGPANVGGLVGRGGGSIANSSSTGSVSGDENVGGLVGLNWGIITTNYSTGLVSGSDKVGGLVGNNYHEGNVISCFWDIETSGLSRMCGIQGDDASGCDDSLGKKTTEMQTASTFLEAGWDFVDETENGTEDIWRILEGQDYPRLFWEQIPEN